MTSGLGVRFFHRQTFTARAGGGGGQTPSPCPRRQRSSGTHKRRRALECRRRRRTSSGYATPKTSAVHRVLESLAGRESRTPRRLDLHRLAGARVAALAGGTLDHAEMTEPHDLHFAALLERRGDGI